MNCLTIILLHNSAGPGEHLRFIIKPAPGPACVSVNLRRSGLKSKDDVVSITDITLSKQDEVIVTIGTRGADGTVHIDAVRLLEVE